MGQGSFAYDINDQGWILGRTNLFGGGNLPFLLVDGQVTLLADFGRDCWARAINNAGQIVGTCDAGVSVPLLWENAEATPVPLAPSGIAFDINDAGQVVGTMGGVASVWQNGELIALGDFPGSIDSQAWTINNLGQIGGKSSQGAVVWFVPPPDVVAPTITFTGADSYTVDQVVNVTCAVADPEPGSGLASSSCPSASGDAYTFLVGPTTLHAEATDNAGNTATASFTFTVSVTPASLVALVQRWTSKPGVAKALGAKLSGKPNAGRIGAFINQVRAQSGKAIGSGHADILIALAQALMD